MKNCNQFIGLWRDNVKTLFSYAILFFLLNFVMIEMFFLKQKRNDVTFLNKKLEKLRRDFPTRSGNKKLKNNSFYKECMWKKENNAWYFVGSFSDGYDCLLHGIADDAFVSNVQLKRNIMGVSVKIMILAETGT